MMDISSVERTAPTGRRAILVLGMHRSGTSALSGVACILGASPPCTLMPATADNPRGYWESIPIMLLSNEVLASAVSAWDDWREFTADWYGSSECERLRVQFREVLQSEYHNTPLLLVKDPRLCRILPFFLTVLEDMAVQPVALLSLRDPLEVALSLQRRDNFPIAKSIALWLRHMLDAELGSRHLPRRLVSYEQLLTDWRLEMRRAEQEIGFDWPVNLDAAASAVGDFLVPDLRHARSDPTDSDKRPELPALAAEAYRLLCALSNDVSNAGLLEQIDVVRSKFNESSRFFGAIVEPVKTDAARLRASFDHASGEIERQRALLDHQVAQLAHFRSEIEEKAVDAARLAQQVDASERRRGELEAELAQVEAIRNEAANLRRALARQDAENRTLAAELAERDERINGVSLELEASRDEANMLHRALAGQVEQNRQTTGQLEALRSSRSWRFTEPFRGVSRFLQRFGR